MTLPLSDGGRTSFARAMLTAGVFSLLALQLISDEGHVSIKRLPLRWLALAGLLTVSSCLVSIFKDLSVKEALTLWSIIAGSILAGHVAVQGHRRALIVTILASGVLVTLLAVPSYLAAPADSTAAVALSGSFHYPNGLGSFLLLIVFLPCAFLFHGGTRLASVASACALGVLGAALILTHSRGVWASGLIALICWTVVERKLIWAHRRRIALAAFLITSLVVMASRRPADIAPRLASLTAATSKKTEDPSFQWRRDIYGWTLDIIKDHPLMGTGIGTFSIAIKLYQRAPYITSLYAHSHYLQTAAEMGLPALFGLLLFLGFLVRQGWKILAALEPKSRERSLAAGLAAGLLGSSLHAAIDLGWSYPAVALVFGVEATMLFSLTPQSFMPRDRGVQAAARPSAMRSILLSFCLVMAVLAGSRYYAEVFRNEGNLALDSGEYDRAVRAFRWSSRLNPLFYSPRQRMALAYAAQGDRRNSQREAEAAFRLNSFDGDSFHALARIHRQAGQDGKAESEFLSAVTLQPYTRPIFYYDLAELSLALGKMAEAQAWLKRGTEIFRPEIVTRPLNRCLAPGDRYILAGMYRRMAEIWRSEWGISEGKRAEEVAVRLARPATEEICFRGMKGPFLAPESTIVAYWESRSKRDWPRVIATFAREADERFKSESLTSLPSDVVTVEVDWIVRLDGNENAAKVGYEVKLLTDGAQVRRVAFTDSLVVERAGWRLIQREIGLN
ncbi:MAG: O-antigen ligase family protein [candidate division NC10 bacterium]|nr:O-antigen ligase family protein [candidate division NC10 bacterium]